MKIKELVKALRKSDSDGFVFIETEKGMHEFSIVSFDDVGDVNLCIGEGDNLA